jgi:hypothetical protein
MAPAKLKELEESLLDAEDNRVLQGTLYRSLTLEELNEGQSESMINAARRRLCRSRPGMPHPCRRARRSPPG